MRWCYDWFSCIFCASVLLCLLIFVTDYSTKARRSVYYDWVLAEIFPFQRIGADETGISEFWLVIVALVFFRLNQRVCHFIEQAIDCSLISFRYCHLSAFYIFRKLFKKILHCFVRGLSHVTWDLNNIPYICIVTRVLKL